MDRTSPFAAILRETWKRSGDWPFRSIDDVIGYEGLAAPPNTCNRVDWTRPGRPLVKRMLAALCLAAAVSAHAQEPYPNRAVKVIVPFSPGTGIDILARTIGQKLSDDWKVPVVVENRPGASGNIGTEAVAKSPPDGYTLLMTANTLVLAPSLSPNTPYDPVKDFAAVVPLAIGRFALVVHPSVPATTVKELVALAKANPGKLNYASPGNGTPHHFVMELFKLKTGVDIVHLPYKGSAQAVQDLVGGQVQVAFLPVHVAKPQVDGGRLVMLASGGRACERDVQRAVARGSGRCPRRRRRPVVRHVRAGRHAAGNRRPPQRRGQSRAQAAGRRRYALQAGPHRHRGHARRPRRVHEVRTRALDGGRAHAEDPARLGLHARRLQRHARRVVQRESDRCDDLRKLRDRVG